jgi:hypothetical protein
LKGVIVCEANEDRDCDHPSNQVYQIPVGADEPLSIAAIPKSAKSINVTLVAISMNQLLDLRIGHLILERTHRLDHQANRYYEESS